MYICQKSQIKRIRATYKINLMKKIILIIFNLLPLIGCFGQRYELWLKTPDSKYNTYGNLGQFNDSILSIYSNPTLFIFSKDKLFHWEQINTLRIRNKSIHQYGMLVGSTIGMASSYLIIKTYDEQYLFAPMFTLVGLTCGGLLIGHLFTATKVTIPLDGKTAAEKSQALRDKITRRTLVSH